MKNTIKSYLDWYKNLNFKESNILIFIILISLSFFVFRDFGVLNVVSDERSYSMVSRLMDNRNSPLSNYIYLNIFSTTNICGVNFYSCAKWLNEIFYLFGCYYIYKIARVNINKNWSLAIFGIVIFLPINSYTSYFMPESLYFLVFWVLIYYLLIKLNNNIRSYIISGALIAVLSLVKPHGVFIIPAIILYLIFINGKKNNIIQNIIKVTIFLLTIFSIRFSIGYFLAGNRGLNLFGDAYGSLNSKISYSQGDILNSITDQFINATGHILPMIFVYFLPLVYIIQQTIKIDIEEEKKKILSMVLLFSSIYFTMVFIATYFTVSVSGYSIHEVINRIHSRYYNFIFPCMLILYLNLFNKNSYYFITNKFKILLTIIYISLFIFMINYKLWFNPNLVDSPEIASLVFIREQSYMLGFLLLAALVLFFHNQRSGLIFYTLIFLPFYIAGSIYFTRLEFNQRSTPDIYDSAGFFVKSLLPNIEISKLLIISPATTGAFRTMFILSNAEISSIELPLNSAVDETIKTLPSKEWVLLIGSYPEPKNITYHMQANGSHLYHIAKDISIPFTQSSWPGIVESMSGIYPFESWGSWSEGKVVSIRLSRYLPSNFDLILNVKSFGENNDIVFSLGAIDYKLKINKEFNEYVIPIRGLPANINSIYFYVKNPISPKKLMINPDERLIGTGFRSLKIVPVLKVE